MSEHGSNGSNGSIEEIGPEEIEESINEISDVGFLFVFLC